LSTKIGGEAGREVGSRLSSCHFVLFRIESQEGEAMTKQSLDVFSLAKHYKGKWIVVSKDGCTVLCAAETLEDAIQESKTYGGVLLRIPAFVKA
jgi:hypothetical protein